MHILICSALFDRKAEGICTGRLVRALLDAGIQITLVTSDRADTTFRHKMLRTLVFPVQPRDPKWLFRAWARVTDGLDCNLYMWSRRAGRVRLDIRPDLVYARAWPDSSLMAGYRIAESHGLPLWIHLSDPFPPPGDSPLSPGRRSDLQRVVNRAQVCTFTNRKTLEYQTQHLRLPHPDWSEVVPHVAPEPADLGPRPKAQRFLYLGTFSRKRDPLILLQAFRLYLERRPQAHILFVGPESDMLRKRVKEQALEAHVSYDRYRVDNRSHMAQADVLIGLDNIGEEPMYSLTKTVEYLVVNRPFLHIVQPSSPDHELIMRFPQTTRTVAPESTEQIAEAMAYCMEVSEDPTLYAPRFEAMRAFDGAAIAENLIARIRLRNPGIDTPK
jgi:hypothetical protein